MGTSAAEQTHKCLHCGRDAGSGQFCCGGCRFIYDTIHHLGLSDFYRYRSADESAPLPRVDKLPLGYGYYDDAGFREHHIETAPNGVSRVSLHLSGIHCAGCVWLVEKLPQLLPGVHTSRLHFTEGTVELSFDSHVVHLSRIAELLHSLGYPSCPLENELVARAERNEDRLLLLRLGVAGFCAANTMLLAVSLFQGWFTGMERAYADYFRWVSLLLAIPAMSFSALPFYRAAFGALAARRLHLDLPISIALLSSFGLSAFNTISGRDYVYFDSATALVFLLLAARYIQRRALRRARDESRLSWSILPSIARVVSGAEIKDVSLQALKPGDCVEVRPGERIPSDGVVHSGTSEIDSSVLTGESLPESVSPGDAVQAGTLNIQSVLQVALTSNFRGSRIGRLMEELAKSPGESAKFSTFSERVSAYFVSTVFALAVVTVCIHWRNGPAAALDAALALLIVTCPCALALAAPLIMALGVSRSARAGILIKDIDAFERLHDVKRVYFDKTGTLTEDDLALTDWAIEEENRREALLALKFLCSSTTGHPVAKALLKLAHVELPAGASLHPEEAAELVPGRGVSVRAASLLWRLGSVRWMREVGAEIPPSRAQFLERAEQEGASVSALSRDGRVVALFRLEERIKPAALACVKELTQSGRNIGILSGDRHGAVSHASQELGIPARNCVPELFPEEKQRIVQSAAETTAMIGDGFNDAGAMQAADVAIAVRGGIEPNVEVADIIVTDGDLNSVTSLFRGAEKLRGTLRVVLAISAIYNIAGAALAMAGMMSPFIAAILMPLSSLTVISIALAVNPFGDKVSS